MTAWHYDLISLPPPPQEYTPQGLEEFLAQMPPPQYTAKPPMTPEEFAAWRREGQEILADVDPQEFAATIRRWRQEDLARDVDYLTS